MPIDVHAHYVPPQLLDAVAVRGKDIGVRLRHEIRPGITGLAQIHGRNALSWEEEFTNDVSYVDNHSFRLDARILFETARCVARRSGISAAGSVTMPEFAPGVGVSS